MDSTSFFVSSLNSNNDFQDIQSFKEWFAGKNLPDEFKVEQTPLDHLDKWRFDEGKSRLFHESGRFFSIEGIHVSTNFGSVKEWDQPIINQPEIGILGIITKVFNSTRYFLMQAKMEPGNINILQLSPTVQATKSNFSRVHKGKLPTYLEYFTGEKKVRILIDQLQTEQGARFLQKRNRNMVVEVFDDMTVYDDFRWLTLAELKSLLRENNILNMDARSVLSTMPLIEDTLMDDSKQSEFSTVISPVGREYIKSYISEYGVHTTDDLISWYNQQKVFYELTVSKKPLSQLTGWNIGVDAIFSEARFFSVIGVSVSAGSREVTNWMQPLLKDSNSGLLAFIIKKINGVVHFLVQAKVEPGNKDIIELSPTISCSNYEYLRSQDERPFMFEEIERSDTIVQYDALQSEEGGRFYHIQNRNMIIEVPESREYDMPPNYIWMTLRQIKEFMRYGLFNIEARSIISAISFV